MYRWEEMEQVNMYLENDKRSVKKKHWGKNFVCHQDFLKLIRTRLNLISQISFVINSKLVPDWNLVPSVKRASFHRAPG